MAGVPFEFVGTQHGVISSSVSSRIVAWPQPR
jgi:hypothetical protein